MMAFDAPSREFCLSRRIRTNTPLQALVTLNDPVFLEAATALAGRMKQAGGGDPGKAISAGYRMALARKPDDKTLAVLMELYQNALKAEQQKGPMVIPTGLNDAKPARLEGPMAVVANAILNLDGFLTKS